MSDERIPQNQPEDELSDEQLEQVSGGDGERTPMLFQALCTNETVKNVSTGFDAGKNEISIETLE